jgi:hypothetical protein
MESTQLGPLVSRHREWLPLSTISVAAIIFLIATFILFTLNGVVALLVDLSFYGVAIWVAVLAIHHFRKRPSVVLYDDGIEYSVNGETHARRWEEFDTLSRKAQYLTRYMSRGSYTQQVFWFSLAKQGDLPVRLNTTYTGVNRKTYDFLCKRTEMAWWPEYLEAFEEGERLKFGVVEICKDGIPAGEHLLPWSEIRGFEEKDTETSTLHLVNGHTIEIGLFSLPNEHILRKFLRMKIPKA